MKYLKLSWRLFFIIVGCTFALQSQASTKVTLEGKALRDSSIQIEYQGNGNVRVEGPQQSLMKSYLLFKNKNLYNVMMMNQPPMVMNLSALGSGAKSFMADKKSDLILSSDLINFKNTGESETIAGITGELFELSYKAKRGTKTIKLVLSSNNEIRAYTQAWINMTRKKFSITGESFSNKNIWSFLENNNYGILRFDNRFQVSSVKTNLNEMARLSLPGEPTESLKGATGSKTASNSPNNLNKDFFDSSIEAANQKMQNNKDFKKVLKQYVGSDEEIDQKMKQNKKDRVEKLGKRGREFEEIRVRENKAAVEAVKLKASKGINLFPDSEFSMKSNLSTKYHNSRYKSALQINHKPKMTRFEEQESSPNSHFFIYREDKSIIWQMIPGTSVSLQKKVYWEIDTVDGKGRNPHIDKIVKAYEDISDITKFDFIGNEILQEMPAKHYSKKTAIPWEKNGFIYYNYWIDDNNFIRKLTIKTSDSDSTLTFYDIKFEKQDDANFVPPANYKLSK